MKIPAKPLTRLIVCIAGISLFSLLLPQPNWAQTAETDKVNPLQDFDPEQNRDPFSSRGNETDAFGGGLFDLMHRAQMGNIRSANEYSSEQNQSLDAAAAEFRARQREQLLRVQPTQVNPANTPQQSN